MVYKTDKKPDEPCSITSSLAYFPDEDPNDMNVTSPPRIPPSNLTVVTVEGCPSFVILDWEKSDNETRGKVQPNKNGFKLLAGAKETSSVSYLETGRTWDQSLAGSHQKVFK